MKEYNGMYLGIVVQNNDPEYRGRVKVYVPHIQANVYENWFSEIQDKNFNFLGTNIQSDLEKILPELKTVLPWATNSMPLVGTVGSGRAITRMTKPVLFQIVTRMKLSVLMSMNRLRLRKNIN